MDRSEYENELACAARNLFLCDQEEQLLDEFEKDMAKWAEKLGKCNPDYAKSINDTVHDLLSDLRFALERSREENEDYLAEAGRL